MHLDVGYRVLRESQQGQRQTTGQREQWCKRRQGADGDREEPRWGSSWVRSCLRNPAVYGGLFQGR